MRRICSAAVRNLRKNKKRSLQGTGCMWQFRQVYMWHIDVNTIGGGLIG